MKTKDYLHGWIFTYNQYGDKWLATTRENQRDLYNNPKSPNVLISSSIDTLQALIIKMKGTINQKYLNSLA